MNRFHRWYCASDHWSVVVRERLLPWVLRDLDLGERVLEVGPGPGITTTLLSRRSTSLTAIEIDAGLAQRLRQHLPHSHLSVVQGDATALPFGSGAFSGAVCFTMLHHVSSPALQDQLLREVARVLQRGAVFAGSDSTPSLLFRLAHLFDTMVLVQPEGFAERLEAAGFADVSVRTGPGAFRFRARRAAA